jgi:pimeloyl-ACP methyl ester carboxylesterase
VDAVAVAGHSQGGGHAALLGKTHRLARVVMLGPRPTPLAAATSPPWLGRPGATPADRFFGFSHEQDPGFERIAASWSALGLDRSGPLVNVDGEPALRRLAHS